MFFAVTGGTIMVIVFYHGNGLHGNYCSFTAVKIPRGKPRGKPWKFPTSDKNKNTTSFLNEICQILKSNFPRFKRSSAMLKIIP